MNELIQKAIERSTKEEVAQLICDLHDEHLGLRVKTIRECAKFIRTQQRGTRYQWESESHFARLVGEMADRLEDWAAQIEEDGEDDGR
ncbi:MAG: hypothetical protein ACQKBU_00050 [Verrucomicrobiales bacterium]